MFKLANRIKVTSTTTGTGTYTLGSAVTGYRTFGAFLSNGDTTFYVAEDGTDWEIGLGTYTTSGTTLARTSVIYSSNSNSAVSWGAGSRTISVCDVAPFTTPFTFTENSNFSIQVTDPTLLGGVAKDTLGIGAVDLQVQTSTSSKAATGNFSFVAGASNTAAGDSSVSIGGSNCHAYGTSSVIIGGSVHSVHGDYSGILGGYLGTINGDYSAIVSGYANRVPGDYSVALGYRANAAGNCQLAQGGGRFAVDGDTQRSSYVLSKQTTNATQVAVADVNANAFLTLPDDSTWAFEVLIVARRTDADNESAAYLLKGCIDRNANAASTALVGTITKEVIAEDTVAWDVDAQADTSNGGLKILVTGEASKTINWVAHVRTVETTG